MIATGGWTKSGIKIWDAKSGKPLSKIKLDFFVTRLAWTSDKKLIAGSFGLIRIFDTATWQQIAVLEGHTNVIFSFALNDRLLASASWDGTVRLWNLDTNLQVGPPLQHKDWVFCAAFSADGKLLSTACKDKNAYVWDIQAFLNTAGLEDLPPVDVSVNLLSIVSLIYAAIKQASSQDSSSEEHGSRFWKYVTRLSTSSMILNIIFQADTTQYFGHAYELPPSFFDNMEANAPVRHQRFC
jgi:WD40 repeat protein